MHRSFSPTSSKYTATAEPCSQYNWKIFTTIGNLLRTSLVGYYSVFLFEESTFLSLIHLEIASLPAELSSCFVNGVTEMIQSEYSERILIKLSVLLSFIICHIWQSWQNCLKRSGFAIN